MDPSPTPDPAVTPTPAPTAAPATPTPAPTATPVPTATPLPAGSRKPAVAIRTPTAAGETTGTIAGRVNPYGLPTTYAFEWGTSSKVYGQLTPAGSVAVGATATVTADLAGLAPNTRYVYRVVATNALGTVKSSARSVTTTRGLTGATLKAARTTLDWGGVTVVSGAVSGTVPVGATVRLMRQNAPYTRAYSEVGSTKAGAAGTFAFSISRIWETARLKVVADAGGTDGVATAASGAVRPVITSAKTPGVESGVVTVRSRVLARLTLSSRTSRSAVLRGVVYPSSSDTRVALQRRAASGRWITVSRPTLRRPSGSERGTFAKRVSRSAARTLRYRMVVTPNDDGAHLTTTAKSVYVPRKR
ncbi:MAG: hypothetical protein J7513_00550 [Solirubrobacteraceae bacterium]|nr:hypothetical protein [Solirubrobacteraceae bacterium]